MLNKYPKTRLALYLTSVALMIVSFFAIDLELNYSEALVKSAVLLSSVAGVTAATNTRNGDTEVNTQE